MKNGEEAPRFYLRQKSPDTQSEVFPHHTFHWLVASLIVLGVGLAVVIVFNQTFYGEIDQLP
ncbi:MAG: hypothetical protein RLZ62_127, partial [Bacteroidota bacterium]